MNDRTMCGDEHTHTQGQTQNDNDVGLAVINRIETANHK